MTVSDTFPLDELVRRVTDEVTRLDLNQENGQVSPVPDGRTLRYYASLGLLDRPVEVRGRRAYYNYRHVLQAVAVKVLQAQGLPLQEIQQRLTGRDDKELLDLTLRPSLTRFWRERPVRHHVGPDVPPVRPVPVSGPMADGSGPTPDGIGPADRPTAGKPASPGITGVATSGIPDVAPDPPVAAPHDPVALRLAEGVIVLIDPARPIGRSDLTRIRSAGSALLSTLAELGITARPQENR